MASPILYTISQPPSVFDDKHSQKEFLRYVREELSKNINSHEDAILKFDKNKTLYGAIVEFPLFTTFPNEYQICDIEYKSKRVWIFLNAKSRSLNTVNGKKDDRLKTSTIVAAIVSHKKKIITGSTDHDIYDVLEEMVNNLIKTYKLIPSRHNHDLQLVTNTRISPVGVIEHFKIQPNNTVKVRASTALITSLNSITSNIANQRHIKDEHMKYLGGQGFASEFDERFVESIYRLVRSRDLNCIGDYGLSLVLSANSVEGFMAAIEYAIRIKNREEVGQVEKYINSVYLGKLKKFAKEEYGLKIGNSSTYAEWYKRSYLMRNDYSHRQRSGYIATESNAAIQLSIKLIIEICEAVIKKYNMSELAQVIEIVEGISSDHHAGADTPMHKISDSHIALDI